jgi:hypothetical protein
MSWLTSLNGGALLALCVGGTVLFALAMLLALILVIPQRSREGTGMTAAAYMTVLGSLFAILTGFLINSEYSTLRQAQNIVGIEVAGASQLAYASASLPPSDTSLVQASLVRYLTSVSAAEWPQLEVDPGARSRAGDDLSSLSRLVFSYGPRPYAPSVTTDAMQTSLATVTESRRQRLVIATQELPLPLFVLSVVTGMALISGALLVALRTGPRYGLVAAGIVLIVGFDLTAILAISAPFAGPFVTSTEPIQQLAQEIASGDYLGWLGSR